MANPNELITATRCGKTFRASRRTFAHIDYTLARLAQLHPGAYMVIFQGAYNTGVAASAGTHDFDAVLDVQIVGLDWWDAQWFLRVCGWAAWYRYPPTFSRHLHIVSLGYTTRVGIYVPGQVDDYHRHALGLKGQHHSGADTSRFPANIADTYFDYDEWENDVPEYDKWSQTAKDQMKADVAAAVSGAIVDGDKLTLGQAARQAANSPSLIRKLGKLLGFDLSKEK